jgi:hypothetical protein
MKPDPTMSFIAFTRLVLDALETAKVEYLIGGSLAVWTWGEPRTTRDFDLVINLPLERMLSLSRALQERDMLVPFDVMLDLYLMAEGDLPINAIHLYTGYKAELFLLRPGDHFRQVALSRRRLVDISPELTNVYVHSPEDLIIYKLRYYLLSEQPKHIRDIQSILLAMGGELDRSYLERWTTHFNLQSAWHKAQNWKEIG